MLRQQEAAIFYRETIKFFLWSFDYFYFPCLYVNSGSMTLEEEKNGRASCYSGGAFCFLGMRSACVWKKGNSNSNL